MFCFNFVPWCDSVPDDIQAEVLGTACETHAPAQGARVSERICTDPGPQVQAWGGFLPVDLVVPFATCSAPGGPVRCPRRAVDVLRWEENGDPEGPL